MMTPEKRSEAARKAWETRRLGQRLDDKQLVDDLLSMADDIQIGGDICFRRLAAVLHKGIATARQRGLARAMLRNAARLLSALSDATDDIEVDHHYLYSAELERQS